jgi:branched-chain amino acid transport system permease protein
MTSALAFTLVPILIDVIAVLGLYLLANTGRLSVGHAAFFGIGAYTSAVLSTRLGMHPFASIAVGAVVGGAAGLLFAAVADRLTHWFFAITTLAFSVMVIGLISGIDYLGAATGLYGVPLAIQLPHAIVAFVAVLGLVLWVDHSPFGRAMRAVRDSEIGAQALGINPARIRILTFGLGTLIAGFAGGLYAHYLGLVKPGDLALERSLLYVVYLSIGGMEYWGGAILGTVLLSAVPELLRFSREYRLALFGLLLTAVMLARPAGLLSGPIGLRRVLRKLRPRPAQADLRTKGS